MIAKRNILKMVRHSARRGEGYPDRRIMHPARDWLIGLAGAALLLLVSGIGAGYLFWSKSNMAPEENEMAIETVKYDPKSITRVLADYRARYALYESLRKNLISTPSATSTATTTATSTEKTKPISPATTIPVAQ